MNPNPQLDDGRTEEQNTLPAIAKIAGGVIIKSA